ncbi:MAG: hypothetical protein RXR51_08425 [Nitrososphaeria archaeon]
MHDDAMVSIPKFDKLADEIYRHFESRCVTIWQIVEFAKKLGYKAPLKIVLFSMKYLGMNGKVFIYRFYDDYNVYCFGRQYNGEDLVNHKEVRRCIEQFLPTFNLANVVECITEKKAIGRNIVLHLAILYELMKMIRERKIRYFVATTDAKNRLKVLVDREITAEDLRRKA